jgi:hypothetical protein
MSGGAGTQPTSQAGQQAPAPQVTPQVQQDINNIAGANLAPPVHSMGDGWGMNQMNNLQPAQGWMTPSPQQPTPPAPQPSPAPQPTPQMAQQPYQQPYQQQYQPAQQPMGYGNYYAQQQYQQPYQQQYQQQPQQPQQNQFQFYQRPQSYSPYGFAK